MTLCAISTIRLHQFSTCFNLHGSWGQKYPNSKIAKYSWSRWWRRWWWSWARNVLITKFSNTLGHDDDDDDDDGPIECPIHKIAKYSWSWWWWWWWSWGRNVLITKLSNTSLGYFPLNFKVMKLQCWRCCNSKSRAQTPQWWEEEEW